MTKHFDDINASLAFTFDQDNTSEVILQPSTPILQDDMAPKMPPLFSPSQVYRSFDVLPKPHSPPIDLKSGGVIAKRQKTHRACIYCRRSHMTCDNGKSCVIIPGRPCKRCLFRKIGQLCRDEEYSPTLIFDPFLKDKKKRGDIYPAYFIGSDVGNSPIRPTLCIAETLNSKLPFNTAIQDFEFKSPAQVVQWPRTEVNVQESFNKKFLFSKNSSVELRYRQLINEKYLRGEVYPFDFFQAYDHFKKKAVQIGFTESTIPILNSLLDEDLAITKRSNRTLEENLNVEVSLLRMLQEYRRYLQFISMPTALWRRSGQVLLCNSNFLNLLGMEQENFDIKSFDILDFLHEQTVLNYWKRFIGIAYDITQRTILTSSFLKSTKSTLLFSSCSFTIRRDIYGAPMIIVGQFIPISHI